MVLTLETTVKESLGRVDGMYTSMDHQPLVYRRDCLHLWQLRVACVNGVAESCNGVEVIILEGKMVIKGWG